MEPDCAGTHWFHRAPYAYPANKALRVPLATKGRDVALHDGHAAALALEREHGQVVVLAVRLAVLLVETVLAKLTAALGAEEVVRVPSLLQRSHAFLKHYQRKYKVIRGQPAFLAIFYFS